MPVGVYDLYSFCGSELAFVDFPNFTVPVDPGENTGDVYLATCPEYVVGP